MHMTLPRLAALNRVWKTMPPLAVSLARVTAWMGYKPEPERKAISAVEWARQRGGAQGAMSKLPNDPELALMDMPLGSSLPAS